MCYSTSAKHNVLIIDDDESVFEKIQRKLEKKKLLDIILHAVTDPLYALDKIDQYRPPLVLLDYKMPNMNGIEVMGNIQTLPKQWRPQVIFLSNVIDHRQEGIALGAIDYFVKAEVSIGRIVESISQVLSESKEVLITECFIGEWDDE